MMMPVDDPYNGPISPTDNLVEIAELEEVREDETQRIVDVLYSNQFETPNDTPQKVSLLGMKPLYDYGHSNSALMSPKMPKTDRQRKYNSSYPPLSEQIGATSYYKLDKNYLA